MGSNLCNILQTKQQTQDKQGHVFSLRHFLVENYRASRMLSRLKITKANMNRRKIYRPNCTSSNGLISGFGPKQNKSRTSFFDRRNEACLRQLGKRHKWNFAHLSQFFSCRFSSIVELKSFYLQWGDVFSSFVWFKNLIDEKSTGNLPLLSRKRLILPNTRVSLHSCLLSH